MLLVPVNNYALHGTGDHISEASGLGVLPSALYTSPDGTIVNPVLGVPCQCVAIPAPSYLLKDAISHPYQQAIQYSPPAPGKSGSWPSSSPRSISPMVFQAQELGQRNVEKKLESSSILLSLLNQPSEKRKSNVTSRCAGKFPTTSSLRTSQNGKRGLRVGLRCPTGISETSSKVMKKVLSFVQNLDSFNSLPPNDQELLFVSSWAKLFVLGMSQEKILFEIVMCEVHQHSNEHLCHGILSRSLLCEKEATKADEADKLRGFVQRCMELELTPVEYAYFMGTVLFDSDIPGLQQRDVIAALQAEALHALAEHRGHIRDCPSHFQAERDQQMRLTQILLVLPALKSTKTQVIADLFFNDSFVPFPGKTH